MHYCLVLEKTGWVQPKIEPYLHYIEVTLSIGVFDGRHIIVVLEIRPARNLPHAIVI